MASREIVVVEDFARETRFTPGTAERAMGYKSGIGIVIDADAGPIGVLLTRFHDQRKFSEDDKNFLRSAANIVGVAITIMRAEDRLRHSQQLEAVGQLTGGIAHDFNNLLTVIMGNLQMVEEDVAGNAAIAQPVEAALRAASNAAELTRKLLAFSRRQALRPRPFDVNERVGGMLEMIRRALGERITIIAYPDPGVPLALADPNQLETALLNLVVNARDAMPKGGRLTIETGTRLLDSTYAERAGDLSADRYVMIAVSDNGTGMPEDVRRRVFDPYFTTKERGKGSGLGLSMVHGFAKQSRGHVAIYSEPGHGTTVRLFLPIAEAQDTAGGPAQKLTDATGDEAILMVEDDEKVRQVGARFLATLGYQVFQAADADQALALLASPRRSSCYLPISSYPGAMGAKNSPRRHAAAVPIWRYCSLRVMQSAPSRVSIGCRRHCSINRIGAKRWRLRCGAHSTGRNRNHCAGVRRCEIGCDWPGWSLSTGAASPASIRTAERFNAQGPRHSPQAAWRAWMPTIACSRSTSHSSTDLSAARTKPSR
jgi:signal transduction histidine kinase